MSLSLLLSAKVESNSKLNFVFSLEIGKEEDERKLFAKTKKHEKEDGISHSNIRIRSWTLLTPARSDPSHISPEIKEIKTPAKA